MDSTPNGSYEHESDLLDAEADRLCNAQRYERSEARRDTPLGCGGKKTIFDLVSVLLGWQKKVFFDFLRMRRFALLGHNSSNRRIVG
jgi:hypothetical protein